MHPSAHEPHRTETVVLGIETSCDETAAAVVLRSRDGRGRILSSIVRSQWEQHREFGGVVPEIAARAHVECLDRIIAEALAEAGVTWSGLDAIAATAGPGLMGGLIVGLVTAKTLALVRGLPLVAVNHLEAHAVTAGLTDGLAPPYLLLLISGGHTQLLLVSGVGSYTRIGTTIDDALGEAFDKTAKLLGLGQPGGPAVERLAAAGDPKRFSLPRPMLGREEPNFSFAGLKTAVRQQAAALVPLGEADVADLCASFQAAVADVLADRTRTAMRLAAPHLDVGARALVIAGGVAANRTIRTAIDRISQQDGWRLIVPPIPLCTDNAAMIAWAACARLAAGNTPDALDFAARARWPLDPDAAPALGSGRLGAKV